MSEPAGGQPPTGGSKRAQRAARRAAALFPANPFLTPIGAPSALDNQPQLLSTGSDAQNLMSRKANSDKMIAAVTQRLIGAGVVGSIAAIEAVVDGFGGSNTDSDIQAAFDKLVRMSGEAGAQQQAQPQQQQISVTSPSAGSPAQPQQQQQAQQQQEQQQQQRELEKLATFDKPTAADPAKRSLHRDLSANTKESDLYDSSPAPLITAPHVSLSFQPALATPRTRSSTANMVAPANAPAATTQALPAQAITTTPVDLTGSSPSSDSQDEKDDDDDENYTPCRFHSTCTAKHMHGWMLTAASLYCGPFVSLRVGKFQPIREGTAASCRYTQEAGRGSGFRQHSQQLNIRQIKIIIT